MTSIPSARVIDVSHTVEHGMVTYKGFPPPAISQFLTRAASAARYEPGTTFQIDRVELVGNTGTYLDSPFHRYADGQDLSSLPLDRLANLECLVARVPQTTRSVDHLPFPAGDVRGRAVLVHTGWDRHWRTDKYFEGHPYLTGALADWLVQAGAALVGIDSLNIDSTDTGERPVHSILLRHGIPIAEHLRGLEDVPVRGGRFFAVPVGIKGVGSFPVRAFVLV